jgi:hypothetical protein
MSISSVCRGKVGAFAAPTDLVCRDDFFYDFLEGFVEEVRICKSQVYIAMARTWRALANQV